MSANSRGISRLAPGVSLLRSYPKAFLRPDVLTALSLWAVVVPQSLAYGELAGLKAVAGLYTALGAMLLYAIFGSSRQLTVGPESSVAIVVGTILGVRAAGDPAQAASIAAALAFLVAGFLLVGALLRLGKIVRLLSSPILMGYLAGAAVIIICSQVPKLFDISVEGNVWWTKLAGTLRALPDTNLASLGIAVLTIGVLVAASLRAPKLPAPLIGIALATVAVAAFGLSSGGHTVSVVGSVKAGVPIPSLPGIGVRKLYDLLIPAASIALLAYASSIATVAALAARSKEDYDPNQEFVGLAAASVGSGFLGGFPSNASDSRSFIIVESGGRSQMVNLIGGGLVLLTLLLLTPLFKTLPTAALGAVVILAASRLIDLKGLKRLYRIRKSDFALALITFAGVLAFDVLPGIIFGVFVSLVEVLRRATFPNTALLGPVGDEQTYRDIGNFDEAEAEPGLVVYRFDAPLFFANADVFRDDVRRAVERAHTPVRMVIINAEGMTDLDVTGAEMLGGLVDWLRERDVRVSFARVRTALRDTMQAQGVEERIGSANVFLRVLEAVDEFHAGNEGAS